MKKKLVVNSNIITKQQRIKALFESGERDCKKIHRKIQRFTPCSQRNVYQILKKLNNGNRPKYPSSLNIWAAISLQGKSQLHIFKENMTSDIYVDIIKKKLVPFVKSKFKSIKQVKLYSDNDPKHVSQKSLQQIQSACIQRVDWPSYSPDLNPIEYIWAIIKQRLSKIEMTNETQLKKNIKKIWKNLSQSVIACTIQTWSDRCQQIINQNGNTISY